MRILFVHQNLGAFGGAEANIHLTASELQRRGHTTALAYQRRTGRGEDAWQEVFSEAYHVPSEDDGTQIKAVLERVKPELVYLHTISQIPTLEALLSSEVPVVRMVHDHEMYCLRGYKYDYFSRHICTRPASLHCVFPCMAVIARNRGGGFPVRWASYLRKKKEIRLNRRFAAHVVYSEYSKQELIRNGFNASAIHVHVPIRCWGEGPTSNFSDRNLILYVGQIIRGKGVDLLLQALAQIQTPFECIILGDGNDRQRCERLRGRLGLDGRVRFDGFVLREQLKQYYLEASVFAVSSVWPEPFGMVGPEAMRYGLPVVAFDAGGIREWLQDGHNGRLVPWADTKRFSAALEELLVNKPLARRMGMRGLSWVNEHYEACRQVDSLEGLFLRLVSNNRPSPVLESVPCGELVHA